MQHVQEYMRPLLICLALSIGLASCGWSETLAACGSDVGEIPPAAETMSEAVSLKFVSETYGPGDGAGFRWNVDAEVDPNTVIDGDEWLVQCWDGDSWNRAWMAMAVYGPEPFPRSLDDDFAVTSDGFALTEGIVAIPDDTPAGWYRVMKRPREDIEVEARFFVQANS